MSHSSLCPQTMRCLSISFSFPLSFRTLQSQFLSLDSPCSSSPPPCFWDLYSPPYVIASPEQTGLFSFTIGPRLERLAEAQRLCFFTRSRKETEGGYCWDIASLCITSAQTCMQKISACEMRMQTNFYCTFITTKDT